MGGGGGGIQKNFLSITTHKDLTSDLKDKNLKKLNLMDLKWGGLGGLLRKIQYEPLNFASVNYIITWSENNIIWYVYIVALWW